METLYVQHPRHTSDLYLIWTTIPTAQLYPNGLEDEFLSPFQSWEHRRRGIEQRPNPEIAIRTPYNHGARRPGDREYPEQPAAVPELGVELLGHDLGRAIEDNDVIGCAGRNRPSRAAVARN